MFLIPVTLMIGSYAHAQASPPVPNVQTGEAPGSAAAPVASSDPRGITQADSGSAIDKPATVGAMPQTGYHPPVIEDPRTTEPLPHARIRAADPAAAATGQPKPRTSPGHRRARRR